jgi:hypothetical protein
MKHGLLLTCLFLLSLSAHPQDDSLAIARQRSNSSFIDASEASIRIYPVPVRENVFNIRSSKEVSSVKITNIIGQDIYKSDFDNSQFLVKIVLDNPQRGMYLVTIHFSDKTRVVKKIMIEGSF